MCRRPRLHPAQRRGPRGILSFFSSSSSLLVVCSRRFFKISLFTWWFYFPAVFFHTYLVRSVHAIYIRVATFIHCVGAKCFCKIFSPHATCMVASLIYTCEVSQLNIPYTCEYVCKRVEQKRFMLMDEVREMLSFQGEGFTKQSKYLNKTYKVPSLDLQNKGYKVPNVRQSVC